MSRIWLAAVVLIAALPAANTLAPAVEHDTWWHLRVGQLVSETGDVPQVDPFSRMSRENPTPWRAYSWLYEVVLYHVHAAFGLAGIMWLRSLLAAGSAALVFAFWFRRAGLTPMTVLLSALVAICLMPLATERPWHVTIAFTAATTWAVTALREGLPVRRIAWLPVLFVVWANVHIQFVLGWGVLGLSCLFPGQARRAAAIGLTAACVAATVLNPYHVGLFEVIWEYATQGAPLKLVQELSAPDPFSTANAATLTAAGAVLWMWAFVQVLRRQPIDWFEIGMLAAAAILASRMNRDIWFVAIAAAAVLRPAPGTEPRRGLIPVLVFTAFIAVRLINSAGLARSTDYDAGQAAKYPVRAVEHIKSLNLPGPVFNDFDWGGYLIWAAPEHPVSIDGRTNLYGNERMLRSFDTWSVEEGWNHDPEFCTCRLVLAQRGRVLTGVLSNQPAQWRIVYMDDIAVVFARRTGPD